MRLDFVHVLLGFNLRIKGSSCADSLATDRRERLMPLGLQGLLQRLGALDVGWEFVPVIVVNLYIDEGIDEHLDVFQ